jgi:hypothetical protein
MEHYVVSVSGKLSRGAVSSKSGKGIRIAELGNVRQVHVVDGVRASRLADGLKCRATSGCWRNVTIGSQKVSGCDIHGLIDGSM